MKLTKFFTESILTDCFQPRKKNGSEKRKMSYEYELKKDLAEYQNQWQSAENEKDRTWQEYQWMREFSSQQDEWKRQFELQNSEWANRFAQENLEWSRRFNAENAYNDPSAQISRLQKAGLNAISFMGGDAAGLSAAPSVQSTPSVGSPAPPSPGTPGGHSVSPSPLANFSSISNTSQMFTSLAALNDALAKTAQTGLNVERQKALLDAEFGAVIAKSDSDRSAALFTGIKAGIEQMHGSDKMKSEIELNLMRSYVAKLQGDNEVAMKHYNDAMTQFVGIQSKYLEDASPELIANLGYLGKLLKAQEVTERTKPALNVSETKKNLADVDIKGLQAKILAPDATKASIADDWLKADDVHKQAFIDNLETKLYSSTDLSASEQMEALKKIRLLRKEESISIVSDALDWLRSKVPAIMSFSVK